MKTYTHEIVNPNFMGGMGQPKQPEQKKKNFWVDQISTAGGILGGIGGSFVAPIAGTAVGAGAGSALGEAIENLITGDDWSKNVVKEGALGAVFGAGPLKLLKGAAGGAKALAAGAGVKGATQAASQAAMTPLRQKAGQALTGAADDLAIKQFRLTPSQLANYKKKFGEDAGQTIRKYGFTTAEDIAEKGITPLQQQFDDAINGITGVTKESLKKSLQSRIGKLTGSAVGDNRAIGSQLKKEANDLLGRYGDVIDAKELNAIRREFDSLVNYTQQAANPARYGVNKRMADAIRETLQGADQTGGLKTIGRELNKLRQLSDNAARQSELGRGSLPAGLGNLIGAGVGGGAFGGPAGALGGYAATQLANSGVGRRAAMRGVEAAGNKLSQAQGGQSLGGIAGRVGTVGLMGGAANQAAQPTSLEDALMNQSSLINSDPSMMTATSMNPPMNAANMDASYQQSAQQSNPYPFENLMADLQRDPANAEDYMKYFQYFQDLFAAEAEKPLSAEAAKTISNAEIGLQAINDFDSMTSQDPSLLAKRVIPGRDALGGALGGLLGTRGADAAAQQIVDTIARLRTGAAITNDEARRFEQFIPTAGDSPQVAQQKLGYLRDQFQMVRNRSGSAGTDLTSALMNAQGIN